MNITQTSVELAVDETSNLTVAVEPSGEKVTYSVQPTGIVTVSAAGKITALKEGTAIITATVGESTDTVSVKVTAKPVTEEEGS